MCYLEFMKRSIRVIPKRGRPVTTGKGVLIGVRMLPDHLALLDAWIDENEPGMSRPDAMRQMTLTMLGFFEKPLDKRYAPAVKAFLERRQSVWSTKNRVEG